jgi:Uma2 family endonuclease
MATTAKLLTAEEFGQLPDDGKRYELIDGALREMAPTVNWHGEVETNLSTLLHTHIRVHGLGRVSCGESLYIVRRNPDRVRAADIASIRRERVPSLEAR